MGEAFNRLTTVQQKNVDEHTLVVAYNCIVRSRGDYSSLERIVHKETADCSHLEADLVRYCKMVKRVM